MTENDTMTMALELSVGQLLVIQKILQQQLGRPVEPVDVVAAIVNAAQQVTADEAEDMASFMESKFGQARRRMV